MGQKMNNQNDKSNNNNQDISEMIDELVKELEYWSRKEIGQLKRQDIRSKRQAKSQNRLSAKTELVMWMCAINGMAMLAISIILLVVLIKQRKKMDSIKFPSSRSFVNLPPNENDIV